MTIEPSPDNPIHKLAAFFPIPDAELEYLENYKHDLIYHYERGFFNLALFSFHYLYMTLIHLYLLKYHRFNLKIINSCRHGQAPATAPSLHLYSNVHDEKGRIHIFSGLDKQIKSQHHTIIKRRDSIAHATGLILSKEDFDDHADESCVILEYIKIRALDEMIKYPTDKIFTAIQDIKAEPHPGEAIDKTILMIQDFSICKKDWEYLTSAGLFDFGDWDDFANM